MHGMSARIFLIAVLFVMLAAAALAQTVDASRSRVFAAPAISAQHLTCSAREDCVAAFAGCRPVAVNRRYESIFRRHVGEITPGISCASYLDPRLVPDCISGTCSLSLVDLDDIRLDRPDWCTSASDCTVIRDYCGHYRSVNAAHRDEQYAIENRYAATGTCRWVETRRVLEQRCTNNSCTVILDNYSRY